MTIATSASDRYDEARAALHEFQHRFGADTFGWTHRVVSAMEALITPPATEETPEQIADRVYEYERARGTQAGIAAALVLAGIQAAWNSWEPETAPGLPSGSLEQLAADAEEALEHDSHVYLREIADNLIALVKED